MFPICIEFFNRADGACRHIGASLIDLEATLSENVIITVLALGGNVHGSREGGLMRAWQKHWRWILLNQQ